MGTDINTSPSRGDDHRIVTNNTGISGIVSSGICKMVNTRLSDHQDEGELTVEKTFQRVAIDNLVRSISVVGTSEKQIRKISALLNLARYAKIDTQERETYFYQAVTLAEKYLGKESSDNKIWNDIVFTYLKFIGNTTDMSAGHFERYKIMYDTCRKSILFDKNERKQREIIAAKNTQTYLSGITEPPHLLDKLESLIGHVRLLIISEASGEVVVRHNINHDGIQAPEDIPNTRFETEVSTFDRKNRYRIAIDHGSDETNNQINETDWNDYIKAIIDVYIERFESVLFHQKYGNIMSIRSIEKKRKKPEEHYEYGEFLNSLISSQLPPGTHESREEYIDNLRKAIDISRLITLSHNGNRYIKKVDLAQAIDHILGGRITRRIYDLVKSIILSRDETMNGLGYPSGLSKADIPIEARIYSIIRSYEALPTPNNLKETRVMLERGKNSGHLDSAILEIFLKNLEEGKISKSKASIQGTVTPYRRGSYEREIDLWKDIMNWIEVLESTYQEFRNAHAEPSKQASIVITIGELKRELAEVADLIQLIMLTRHGRTKSDKQHGRKPGTLDEPITEKGKQESRRKGKRLQGLDLQIHAHTEAMRVKESVEIIRQTISGRVSDCLSDDRLMEGALRNPDKNKDNGRYSGSFLRRIIVDNAGESIEFLDKILLSSQKPTKLLVSHADVIKAMAIFIENTGQPNRLLGRKRSVDNTTIIDFLMRGGRTKDWDLLFDFESWKLTAQEVDKIAHRVFGKAIYPRNMKNISLFTLNDTFLDYIDEKNEKDREKVGGFIRALNGNILTEHFSRILRKKGMI